MITKKQSNQKIDIIKVISTGSLSEFCIFNALSEIKINLKNQGLRFTLLTS